MTLLVWVSCFRLKTFSVIVPLSRRRTIYSEAKPLRKIDKINGGQWSSLKMLFKNFENKKIPDFT